MAYYAGSFSRSLGRFTQIDMPSIDSLHESIRVGMCDHYYVGKVIGMRDVLKVLDYLDTGYCGRIIKT